MAYYKSFYDNEKPYYPHESKLLPQGDEPGEWVEAQGPLIEETTIKGIDVVLENGLHIMREQDLAYCPRPILWEAEIDGEVIERGSGIVCRRARLVKQVKTWDYRSLIAWSCDCAERVLPIFEESSPNDERPRKAIKTARAWLVREASVNDLHAATMDAQAASSRNFDVAMHAALAAASCAAYPVYTFPRDPRDVAAVANYAAALIAAHDSDPAFAVFPYFDFPHTHYINAFPISCYGAGHAAMYAANATCALRMSNHADIHDKEYAWQSRRMMEYIRGEVSP